MLVLLAPGDHHLGGLLDAWLSPQNVPRQAKRTIPP